MKKRFWMIILLIYCVLALLFLKCFRVNQIHESVLIRQFGKVLYTVNSEGVYWINPLQEGISVYMGENMYDINETSVITKDKKNMISDAVITWKVIDPELYYQRLGSVAIATDRLSSNSYSSMKTVFSSTTQDEAISGKDGKLSLAILNAPSIQSLEEFGIAATSFDIKALDLPEENREAVYKRMISERNSKKAAYEAEGDKYYNSSKAETDASVRKIKSDANVKAAEIIADGNAQYYEILRNAYSASPEKEEFYEYWIGLETLKESLKNGGTIQITSDDPLYKILINSAE